MQAEGEPHHVAVRGNPLLTSAVASAGACVLHAAAAGAHSDTTTLARIFVIVAAVQGAVALAAMLRPGRPTALALFGLNTAAAGAWLLTRVTGLRDVPGLEVAESPGLADTLTAALAVVAAVAALAAVFDRFPAAGQQGAVAASVLVAALAVPALFDVTAHDHGGHAHGAADAHDAAHDDGHDDGHDHALAAGADEVAAPAQHEHPAASDSTVPAEHAHEATDAHAHAHGDTATSSPGTTTAEPEPTWPRPWNPDGPIDFSNVPGVTPDQQARAEQLVADTLRELPAFADVDSLAELGYRSIGDASTGFEHYINLTLLGDDKVLDPTAPESLVYRVDGANRTLVSAMFIARATGIDDPELTGFAGPLMQWHNHTNLCWGPDASGEFVVQGVSDDHGGTCPAGQVNTGGEFPMVHVWIAPHECGPFAALEGHGAGQVGQVSAGDRVDLCGDHQGGHGDSGGHDDHDATVAVPYDPTKPIDLSGVAGVTPEQQAFAENLVADTVRNLPQWSDPAVAEAAGFHSIQDGGTGHEHYIQWDWINDDVWLDPDHPESLVYEPQPDGSKRLVSAMYMLPDDVELADVPDWGGALMQWHVHGDLCFTADPVAPTVGGTKPIGGTCQPPLVDRGLAPMIHVWITPNPCGPFAALEGIGAGQVAAGEEHFCNTAHGGH